MSYHSPNKPPDGEAEEAVAKGRKVGRLRIEFDLEMVEALGRLGATAEEMAHVLPASQSTVEHRMTDPTSDFYNAYKRGQSNLKVSLRRQQISMALKGDRTMCIWLGKQLLGQRDRADLRHVTVDLSDLSASQLKALTQGATLDEVVGNRWREPGNLATHNSKPSLLPGNSHS